MNEILKKRIEEAAEKYSEEYRPDESLYGIGTQIGYLQGFLKGANYALTHQWISVDEALPELMERVLVAYRLLEGISICIMKRIPHDSAAPNNGKWHWSLVNHKEDVIAWMSLPEFETKDNDRHRA